MLFDGSHRLGDLVDEVFAVWIVHDLLLLDESLDLLARWQGCVHVLLVV